MYLQIKKQHITDLIICFAVVIIVVFVAGVFDLSERWYELSAKYEGYELDEVLIGVASASIMFVWFSYRRLKEMRAEEIRRLKLDAELSRESEARKKTESVGQLTAGVAHDFNNILSVVLGHAEIINGKTDKYDRNLESIINATNKGVRLTQYLLSYSKQQQLFAQPLDVSKFLNENHHEFERAVGGKATFSMNVTQATMPVVADPHHLRNAVISLLRNAGEAVVVGGKVQLNCEVKSLGQGELLGMSLEAGDYIAIAIEDNGSGISADKLDKVFDPFYTTKEIGEGTGLGLSMVQGFMSQSGGFVNLGSDTTSGTVVTLYFPKRIWIDN